MPSRAKFFTGDDVNLRVQLYDRDGAVFTISPTATVTAVLRQGKNQVTPEVACSNSTTGADWTCSLVAVLFTSAQTALVPPSRKTSIEVEIVETGGNVKTWLAFPIAVLEDTI